MTGGERASKRKMDLSNIRTRYFAYLSMMDVSARQSLPNVQPL